MAGPAAAAPRRADVIAADKCGGDGSRGDVAAGALAGSGSGCGEADQRDSWASRATFAVTARGENLCAWAMILFLNPGMATRVPSIIARKPYSATSLASAEPTRPKSRA